MKLKAFFAWLIVCSYCFAISSVWAVEKINELAPCVLSSHCAFIEIESNDLSSFFQKSIEAVNLLPRTEIIEKDNFYIHAESTTKLMHFVDDLEIKAVSDKSLLQIRSESRIGVGDFGVNKKRIDQLIEFLCA